MKILRKILKAGQIIKVVDAGNNSWHLGIKSFISDNKILCEQIDAEGALLGVQSSNLKLSVPYDVGIYVIPVKILKVSPEHQEYELLLGKDYEFVQRRDYYRLPNPQIFAKCRIHGEELKNITVTDLSGAGLGLIVKRNRPIKKDTLVEIEASLIDGNTISIAGRAARVMPMRNKDTYFLGINFTRIGRGDRAKVMRHIFQEQLKEKKKELYST